MRVAFPVLYKNGKLDPKCQVLQLFLPPEASLLITMTAACSFQELNEEIRTDSKLYGPMIVEQRLKAALCSRVLASAHTPCFLPFGAFKPLICVFKKIAHIFSSQ